MKIGARRSQVDLFQAGVVSLRVLVMSGCGKSLSSRMNLDRLCTLQSVDTLPQHAVIVERHHLGAIKV